MKGLSLTLTIVIIAIVLLVTALVIMTIFGSQMAKIMNILTPWVDTSLKENDCRNRCASWCLSHPSTASTAWGAGDANNPGVGLSQEDAATCEQKIGANCQCN